MLDPDDRSLYCDALKPPVGYRFDQAVATTYSLDLLTLLTIPLHLVKFSAGQSVEELLKEQAQVGLYEALRRTANRLSIFCQGGRIAVPRATSSNLVHLLECAVYESKAPEGGALHAKIWILRYIQTGSEEGARPLLRLLILTRNLTSDRCWDLSLMVEGEPGGRRRSENRQLGDLVKSLPDMALRDPGKRARERCELLSEEVRRIDWGCPDKFQELRIHVLGMGGRRWMPTASQRMAIISPFVSADAIRTLVETSRKAECLISRMEELDKLPPEVPALFESIFVLSEAAETEDGEETENSVGQRGLHAKSIITENGWDTTIYVGSANATSQAMLSGKNIEVVAELTGKRSKVGGIDTLLGRDGLGPLLVPFTATEEHEVDEVAELAEELLEQTRLAMAEADLCLVCNREIHEEMKLCLKSPKPFALPPLAELKCWLITHREDWAVDALPLSGGFDVELGASTLEALTGFVAFRAVPHAADVDATFVLNVPIQNAPEDRGAAILKSILRNSAGFYRYLLLLLAEAEADMDGTHGELLSVSKEWKWLSSGLGNGMPLLEEMARAYSRDPSKLKMVGRTIGELRRLQDGDEIVPPEFLELWSVFEAALKEQQ